MSLMMRRTTSPSIFRRLTKKKLPVLRPGRKLYCIKGEITYTGVINWVSIGCTCFELENVITYVDLRDAFCDLR